jgi:hypothetical protein
MGTQGASQSSHGQIAGHDYKIDTAAGIATRTLRPGEKPGPEVHVTTPARGKAARKAGMRT